MTGVLNKTLYWSTAAGKQLPMGTPLYITDVHNKTIGVRPVLSLEPPAETDWIQVIVRPIMEGFEATNGTFQNGTAGDLSPSARASYYVLGTFLLFGTVAILIYGTIILKIKRCPACRPTRQTLETV